MSTPSVASEQSDAPAPSPFHRMSDFLAIPRVGGLALSSGAAAFVSAGESPVRCTGAGTIFQASAAVSNSS